MNFYLLMIHFYDALQTIPILNACILNFYLKLKDEINISQENIHLSIDFISYRFCTASVFKTKLFQFKKLNRGP